MVGINTVINDNPKLTVRVPREESRNPLRVVVDSTGKIPVDSYIVMTAQEIPTLIATTEFIGDVREKALLDKGVVLLKLPSKDGKVDVKALMHNLHSMGLDSVLLEGGSKLNAACLAADVVDKVMFYVAPKILGGEKALTPVGGNGIDAMKDAIDVNSMTVRRIGEDFCIEGYINEQRNRKD
jgi:diaminohydroxyphosphoribosylaminopyrimidine deaminase/5-amino-6-(5-phosphoribosylamino)uracil reductase